NLLLYKDETVWRFKKVDATGRHENVQTFQQRAFDDQLELPGLPAEATRLTSGYQPDVSGETIERVIIARPIGRSMLWSSQVNVVHGAAAWEDITPRRLPGTTRIDLKGRRGG